MEKGALKLCRVTKIKLRQIERSGERSGEHSGYFLLDHNGQTRVYRLVSGPPDVWLRRNHDSLMEDDDDIMYQISYIIPNLISCKEEIKTTSLHFCFV